MLVILSQRIDIESEYSDDPFIIYHYPSRYRNQLHVGDVFIYYQGNRYDKGHRYYFGTGIITEISASDEENYYAKLGNCKRFTQKVPIYLPDGGYIEQLGYQSVRKSINPPWQSSIRPLSEDAYNYILKYAGVLEDTSNATVLDNLKDQLKKSIRSFYVEKDDSAILEIGENAISIAKALNLSDLNSVAEEVHPDNVNQSSTVSFLSVEELFLYCKNMKMSYSYKAVLIIALLELRDQNWGISIGQASEYFKDFYCNRRAKGLPVELRRCIYQDPSTTLDQIAANVIANPVKALIESGFFEYIPDDKLFFLNPALAKEMTETKAKELFDTCEERLDQYYSR